MTHATAAPDAAAPPLAGRRVVEISTRVAGGYCGLLLQQLGAEVTRVALPVAADCPPALYDDFVDSLHAGKGSVEPLERDVIKGLVAMADVVVVDSRRDDAADGEAVSLTAALLENRPDSCALVDIGGHREASLEHPVPGTTTVGAATTPLTATALSAMSWSLGHHGQAPLTLPYDIGDYMTGSEAAGAAALAMLVQDAAPTLPQDWDIAATDVLASYVGQIAANFLPYERPWHRDGPRATLSGGSYPAAMFACADGHISIMCRTQREWHALLDAMGRPPWSKDERFFDSRVVARFHADEADPYLIAWTKERTRDEIFALGKQFGFPMAPVLTVSEAMAQEQFAVRDFLRPAGEDNLVTPGQPWKVLPSSRPATANDRRSGWPRGDVALDTPLAGLRVLDLSWVWSGPMVTAGLGALGAEILKVEHRDRADPSRLRGAGLRGGVPIEGPDLEVTPYFNQMNYGKQSLAINMGTADGAALIKDLAADVDVVVENMRPGALARRGLTYEVLSERNPGLVVLSMSLMGQSGPLRGLGGYAPVMSGLAGLDSLVGYSAEDLIGLYNPALGDPNGASHALAVLLAALAGRQRTGRGCWLDVAQVEAMVAIQRLPVVEAQRRGHNRVPGNSHSVFWPHGTWAASGDDEWLTVAARTDRERSALASVVGAGECWSRPVLEAALARWSADRPAVDGATALLAAGVPAAKVLSFEEMVDSDWAAERRPYTVVDHRYLGEQALFSLPWKHSGRGFQATQAAPLLGAHTDAALSRVLGLDDEALAALRLAGAVE